jgi:hypothetical protein
MTQTQPTGQGSATQSNPIAQYYDNPEWFRSLASMDEGNERAMYCVFGLLGVPGRHLDLGCGSGVMLRTSFKQGAEVMGVECSMYAREQAPDLDIVIGDLTRPLPDFILQGRPFDLVTCIEVAEHVEPSGNDVFLDNVAHSTYKWLVFTGAIPGQGGTGHINCRPRAEWIQSLNKRGLVYDQGKTDELRMMWAWCTGGLVWLPQNVTVFYRA